MLTFRSARSEDEDALYAISLATGDAGQDATPLYNDGRMVGHIYSVPYLYSLPRMRKASAVTSSARSIRPCMKSDWSGNGGRICAPSMPILGATSRHGTPTSAAPISFTTHAAPRPGSQIRSPPTYT